MLTNTESMDKTLAFYQLTDAEIKSIATASVIQYLSGKVTELESRLSFLENKTMKIRNPRQIKTTLSEVVPKII